MPRARQLFVSVLGLLLAGCESGPAHAPSPPASFAAQREQMVAQQVRARGVKDDRVLAAMRKVPREEFVPADQRGFAYEDRPLPIGEGQTISQPYIVALMTELLDVKKGDTVLEIGTGSGYQAAVLAELTTNVYTIEIILALAKRADETLRRLGYTTVQVKTGDGYLGWPEHAPFDGIIVTCAPDRVPKPLQDQLAEGGRMVIPVGPEWTAQTLYLLQKTHGRIEKKAVISVQFVPMVRERRAGPRE